MESDASQLGTAEETPKLADPSFPPIAGIDPADCKPFNRWLDQAPGEVLARQLETLIGRSKRFQDELRSNNLLKRRVSDRFVQVLRDRHPTGLIVNGILYRAHADGLGVERIPTPSHRGGLIDG